MKHLNLNLNHKFVFAIFFLLFVFGCENEGQDENYYSRDEKQFLESILENIKNVNFNISDTLLYSDSLFQKIVNNELREKYRIDSLFKLERIESIEAKCYVSHKACYDYFKEEKLSLKKHIKKVQRSMLSSLIDLDVANTCERRLQKEAYRNFKDFEVGDSVIIELSCQKINEKNEVIFSNCGNLLDSLRTLRIWGVVNSKDASYDYDGASRFWMKFKINKLEKVNTFLYRKQLLVDGGLELNLKSSPYKIIMD